MIYEQIKIEKLAEDIKDFLRVNNLAKEFVERLSRSQQAGKWIPEMIEVMDNGCLRNELICFLTYQISIMECKEQKEKGRTLRDELDYMDTMSKNQKCSEMEKAAWEVAELLQELDYFKYASYMRCMDQAGDPVRRIYSDLMDLEKKQELSQFLLRFHETEMGERIQKVVDSIWEEEKLTRPQTATARR